MVVREGDASRPLRDARQTPPRVVRVPDRRRPGSVEETKSPKPSIVAVAGRPTGEVVVHVRPATSNVEVKSLPATVDGAARSGRQGGRSPWASVDGRQRSASPAAVTRTSGRGGRGT